MYVQATPPADRSDDLVDVTADSEARKIACVHLAEIPLGEPTVLTGQAKIVRQKCRVLFRCDGLDFPGRLEPDQHGRVAARPLRDRLGPHSRRPATRTRRSACLLR